ncbi:MAG: M23 family metallopeptidase [Chitinophagaceae bacterium]|nr:M23 family metallopeptidase [Chitinophagaceae bacterium]
MKTQKNLTHLLLLLFVINTSLSSAQTTEPVIQKGYFRNPMNIPISLSANFGELRNNHWHMGLDIRTQQRENLPVHAAADGYVSRVSVAPFGFGQCIYITHPNGYTTVYGHINTFYPALDQYVKNAQYANESWAIDLRPEPGQFPVKKGQFIANSGNTGGSQGPHLHFEIRETVSEKCVNPLLFGFAEADAIPPVITRLALYDRSKGLYEQAPRLVSVIKPKTGGITTNPAVIQTPFSMVSLAIGATDRTNISSGPNGIYSASLKFDGRVISLFVHDKIGYDETLYLNAQIDYRYRTLGGAYLQHLSRLPGDDGPAPRFAPGEGIIQLKDTLRHSIEIEVRDHNGNKTILRSSIQYKPGAVTLPALMGEKFPPGHISVFERPGFEAVIREGSLYDTIRAMYKRTESFPTGAVSALHQFGDRATPIHERVTIQIQPDRPIPDALRDKLVVKRVTGKNDEIEKVTWIRERLQFTTRYFGSFQLFIDTTAPVLNAPGKGKEIDLRKASAIVFRPRDNFDEIRNFRAELDGKWLRFTNDKGRSFIYRFDEHCGPGKHTLKVEVEDFVGNRTVGEWVIIR